ncbi:hypothetical protein OZX57_07135 [Bifidobacterium sp. ESL0682]|uniref:hypothetical protein n=1 Tax=Bifidobacterium sp. ESL0682 TaxID=2983212 RepID=UPI0023F67B66|nr:hypothetical protein [Bifidobacterium sp. ESL0682]WEV41736.1 hypothetical protein OZX57_07135 [Bifidobacterium sp. ESL0682]
MVLPISANAMDAATPSSTQNVASSGMTPNVGAGSINGSQANASQTPAAQSHNNQQANADSAQASSADTSNSQRQPSSSAASGQTSSSSSLPLKQADLPTASSLATKSAPTQQSGTPAVQQNPSTRGGSGLEVKMNEMLDSDVASVTQLKLSDDSGIVTGTAPFDSDDNAGDDSSASNKIVRSFDKITYNYDFAVNPDDPMTYYKSARVGFRFELPISSDKASFDLNAMNWVDQTPGYQPQSTTETIDGVPTQVLTAYRLMTPTSTSPTAVPGAAGIALGVNVKAAVQGDVIQPKVTAWAAPNDVQHRSMTDTPAAVTVSAKLNMNLRITGIQNEISPEMSFDFNRADPSVLNYGLGKRSGMMAMVNWAVDMRWHDQTKGLRGLEKPQGDVTFSISASSQWKKNGASGAEPARADLQPYYWDYGPVTQGDPFHDSGRNTRNQGWSPRLDNYHYARSARGDASDSVYQNGNYNIGQDRQSDKTVFQFTLSNYDINGTFPYYGDAHNVDACSNVLMSEGCVTQRVGEISTGYLYVFFPSSIPDSSAPNGQKSVVDLYGGAAMSLQSKISDGGLSANSITPGDKLRQPTDANDVSNQAAGDDDSWSASTLLDPPGQFSNYFYYSCPSSNTARENGTDCGTWEASDWQHGTDTAMAGTTARIFSASDFDTGIRDLPVGSSTSSRLIRQCWRCLRKAISTCMSPMRANRRARHIGTTGSHRPFSARRVPASCMRPRRMAPRGAAITSSSLPISKI